jgi:hypothetical protein
MNTQPAGCSLLTFQHFIVTALHSADAKTLFANNVFIWQFLSL